MALGGPVPVEDDQRGEHRMAKICQNRLIRKILENRDSVICLIQK